MWLEEEKDKEKHLNKRLKATNKVLYIEKKFSLFGAVSIHKLKKKIMYLLKKTLVQKSQNYTNFHHYYFRFFFQIFGRTRMK